MKRIAGTIGDGADAPLIKLTLYTPANAQRPVPVILLVNFGGGPRRRRPRRRAAAPLRRRDPPVAAEIIARGWGYATVGYQDIQPDRADTFDAGRHRTHARAGPDGAGAGRVGHDQRVGVGRQPDRSTTSRPTRRSNAKQIALFGHSRLGKTALWASAHDERIAAVFSSCSGEMGSALARRDWGETVDDMAQNFPWRFAGNFQKWVGRWNEMPVDAHMLIALSAPRPVFITGGTADQWADPVGEFLAEVAAGPGLSAARQEGSRRHASCRPLDTPLTSGDSAGTTTPAVTRRRRPTGRAFPHILCIKDFKS